MAICCVARSEWASRRPCWRKAPPTRPPKPTCTAPAERFQRAIGEEHFDAGACPRVEIVERLMACALFGIESHVCLRSQESRQSRFAESHQDGAAHRSLIGSP